MTNDAPERICDGCNVREPWEHKCSGGDCVCVECNYRKLIAARDATIAEQAREIEALKKRDAAPNARLHNLWNCSECGRTWQRSPRSEECPFCRLYIVQQRVKDLEAQLEWRYNRTEHEG